MVSAKAAGRGGGAPVSPARNRNVPFAKGSEAKISFLHGWRGKNEVIDLRGRRSELAALVG